MYGAHIMLLSLSYLVDLSWFSIFHNKPYFSTFIRVAQEPCYYKDLIIVKPKITKDEFFDPVLV